MMSLTGPERHGSNGGRVPARDNEPSPSVMGNVVEASVTSMSNLGKSESRPNSGKSKTSLQGPDPGGGWKEVIHFDPQTNPSLLPAAGCHSPQRRIKVYGRGGARRKDGRTAGRHNVSPRRRPSCVSARHLCRRRRCGWPISG